MVRTPIAPGEILAVEMEQSDLTAKKLTDLIEIPTNQLYQPTELPNI